MTSHVEGCINQILSITLISYLFLEKEPVFPFSMLRAKQGNYWYHLYNVFGMTLFLTGDWTGTSRTRNQHSTTRLSRRRCILQELSLIYFIGYEITIVTFFHELFFLAKKNTSKFNILSTWYLELLLILSGGHFVFDTIFLRPSRKSRLSTLWYVAFHIDHYKKKYL